MIYSIFDNIESIYIYIHILNIIIIFDIYQSDAFFEVSQTLFQRNKYNGYLSIQIPAESKSGP